RIQTLYSPPRGPSTSCPIVARVSSTLAATEFHSLSPPCDHSADTPGPLMHQPGVLLAGKSRYEGFSRGSCKDELAVRQRMFPASYQRYSKLSERGSGSPG